MSGYVGAWDFVETLGKWELGVAYKTFGSWELEIWDKTLGAWDLSIKLSKIFSIFIERAFC